MSQPSIDAKAVVRAADALTTQVRRIADALTTPVDAQPTTADDGARYRLDQVRNAAALHRKGLISDMELNAVIDADAEAPAADEDAQRTTRRNSLLNLLDRLDRTRTLTPEERTLLRQHVDAEIREVDTARAVAAGNKRHVQIMYDELTQANEAARRAMEQRQEMAEERYAIQEQRDTADRIRADVQRDRDQHSAVLTEVLHTFAKVMSDDGQRVVGFMGPTVDPEMYELWTSVVAPTVERPWWQQLAEAQERARKAERAADLLADSHRRAEQAEDLLRVAHETSNRSEAERARAVQRAESAELELRVLRTGLRAAGGDPTQTQNLWAQIRLRNRQWRDAKRERDEAQAAIERVRAVVTDAKTRYTPGRNDYEIGMHDMARDVLAALDGTEQPTTEP